MLFKTTGGEYFIMSELLFEAITGPKSGEGTKWWELNNDANDRTNGVLSDGTLYLYPFFPTNSNLLIGNDVERILFPTVNAKFDRQEIFDNFGILSPDPEADDNTYENKDLEDFVRDLADTGVVIDDPDFGEFPQFQTFIEGLEDERFQDPEFSRQPETEGPFTFGTNDFAYADGFYVAINTAQLPSSTGGIEVQGKGQFSLLNFDDKKRGNALDPLYDAFSGFNFSQDNTYTFEFELNEIKGRNRKDLLIGDTDGESLRDLIDGGKGPDILIGKSNNDNLRGGKGRDILNGTGLGFVGTGEIDILNGGKGRDTFVLGNRFTSFYLGEGLKDYAIIEDFKFKSDKIRLKGHSSMYELDTTFTLGGTSGTGIVFKGSDGDDLIGFVQDVQGLDLNSSTFSYVT